MLLRKRSAERLMLFVLLLLGLHCRCLWSLQPTAPSSASRRTPGLEKLPIAEVMPNILESLREKTALVLQAPPGAGKTTMVPLELLRDQCKASSSSDDDDDDDDAKPPPWLPPDSTIIMLEPRRLAARAAAERMASTLGEPCGATVGYRVRLDSKVTPGRTRIECVTEGVLLRRLQRDPALEGVAAVLFDEFHERSLDADLALCLCRDAREHLRPDLRLVVMSATLGDDLARRLVHGDDEEGQKQQQKQQQEQQEQSSSSSRSSNSGSSFQQQLQQ